MILRLTPPINCRYKSREVGVTSKRRGWLERIPDKDEVTSSILVSPTEVVQ
jgi:hypothetical protein